MHNKRIAFIGGGNIARSLIGGMIADGVEPGLLCASDPDADQRAALSEKFDIETHADNRDAARGADTIVIAVKPQVLHAVARELATVHSVDQAVVISIAAGIRESDLQNWLGGRHPIVRAMPNTPALLGCGVSALYANRYVDAEQREMAESILRAVGAAIWLDDEHLMDAVTAVSGSGPAYFFLFMEVIADAARQLGLSEETARLLTVETAIGAARMALETSDDLATLRRHVTSPGGTTTAAMQVLDSDTLRELITEAVRRAHDRAAELAEEFGRL